MASTLCFLALTTNYEPRAAAFGGRQKTSVGGKSMVKYFTIGVAALAFGMALASVPAFAQTHYGRALNDGGMADDYSSTTPAKPLYNSATPTVPATPHYGRALNDGGMADDYSSTGQPAAKTQNQNVQQQTPPHYGKPLNDGGF
jgi:hypothetical protein